METRRLIVAMIAALTVFFAYNFVRARFFPPKPVQPTAAAPQPAAPIPAVSATQPASGPTTNAVALGPEYVFTQGPSVDNVTLGGGPRDKLTATLSPVGAAMESLCLTERVKPEATARYRYRAAPRKPEPYQLLYSVEDPVLRRTRRSYETPRIWIGDQPRSLESLTWRMLPSDPESPDQKVAFQTTLQAAEDPGAAVLRITKTYTLIPDQPLIDLSLEVENLGESPIAVALEQDGPLGIPREQMQYDMRRLMTAFDDGEVVTLAHVKTRANLAVGEPVKLPPKTSTQRFMWALLSNRYFGVFTRPLPEEGESQQTFVLSVSGTVVVPGPADHTGDGDLISQIVTTALMINPRDAKRISFEIYAGSKNADDLALVNPAYADETKLGYGIAQFADRTCMCTFGWLTQGMSWLLHGIHAVVRNYGVAIIILVIIIRTLLHPLTVFQQKSMFRTQEGMSRIQPKMQAIKEKYANDKAKQNQETMKLFSEEGVNPMASFVSMIPMFIQMPILVAMWISLNGDVALRHQPFVFWMRDLSSPDALITFGGAGFTIPILGQILPSWFAHIPMLNVLPILMGVSMYVQQKYMPKPGQQARRDQARKSAESGGNVSQFEAQMKQQHMIAVMMSFMFPLFFYYMPSGLNLYWMSTNVFGIFETLVIRRQLEAEKQRKKDKPPPDKPRKKGPLARFFSHLAEQAEEIQKKADQATKLESGRKGKDGKDGKKGK